MDRYRITLTRDGRKFAILDRERYDYCGLPGEDGKILPLEWSTRRSAEAWLQKCYRMWQTWEGDGAGTAPKRWRPHHPEPSPFDANAWNYDR
ncbi:hypothetical protein OG762_52360 (plasmid) [Streptomyces sp. NBC_01136]|uniref:hypothetical protein n=1 Tax=Streptomyces sp. NBC_01136 TaxID=2903754 RepID=UPI0037DC5CA5|nr:hypothetical protein OG762_52360 [Streptomyces sp. NBC_01136]